MSLVAEIKSDLFTVKGLGVWLLTSLVFVGVAGSWIVINVNFLGNDTAFTMIPDAPIRSRK